MIISDSLADSHAAVVAQSIVEVLAVDEEVQHSDCTVGIIGGLTDAPQGIRLNVSSSKNFLGAGNCHPLKIHVDLLLTPGDLVGVSSEAPHLAVHQTLNAAFDGYTGSPACENSPDCQIQ